MKNEVKKIEWISLVDDELVKEEMLVVRGGNPGVPGDDTNYGCNESGCKQVCK